MNVLTIFRNNVMRSHMNMWGNYVFVFETDSLHGRVYEKLEAISLETGTDVDDICKEASIYVTNKYAASLVRKYVEVVELANEAMTLGENLHLSIDSLDGLDVSDTNYLEGIAMSDKNDIAQLLEVVEDTKIRQLLTQADSILDEMLTLDREFDIDDNEYTRAVDALYREVTNFDS